MERWNSGLAKAMYDPMTTLRGQQAQADAVEELINSCEEINTRLAALARVYPGMGVESSAPVVRFRAAIEAAKNWK